MNETEKELGRLREKYPDVDQNRIEYRKAMYALTFQAYLLGGIGVAIVFLKLL